MTNFANKIDLDVLIKLIDVIIDKYVYSEEYKLSEFIDNIKPVVINRIEEKLLGKYREDLFELTYDEMNNIDSDYIDLYVQGDGEVLEQKIRGRVEGYLFDDIDELLNDFHPLLDIRVDSIDQDNILDELDYCSAIDSYLEPDPDDYYDDERRGPVTLSNDVIGEIFER